MKVLGVDLGGTQLRAAILDGDRLGALRSARVPAQGSREDVLAALYAAIDAALDDDTAAIGVGFPSLVDPRAGLVRSAPNIPSWQDLPLAKLLADRYRRPVHVENDANCFVVAEHRLGAARGHSHVVGLTLGTGTGAGVIVGDRLQVGAHGGAGELGLISYRGHRLEDDCSGAYFTREHGRSGEALFDAACGGDVEAREAFSSFGAHLGRLVEIVVATLDPELIVFGGSVSRAFELFAPAMREALAGFPYPLAHLSLVPAALEQPGVVGAALLAAERAR